MVSPLFPDVNPTTVDQAGAIVMYCLIGIFTIVFLVSLLVLVQAVMNTRGWNMVKLLKVLLPWPVFARDVSFLLNLNNTAEYMTGPVSAQSSVFLIFTSGAPGYLLFSVFLLLVLFWVYLFHLSSSRIETFVKRLMLTYIAINIIVYFLWFSLLILMVIYPSKLDNIHMAEGIYAASLSIFVAIGILVYGTRLLLVLKKQREINFITKRISILTFSCTVLFVMRSIVILLNQFLFTNSETGLLNLCGITFNCVFCEVLPVVFILLVLCWPQHRVAFSQLQHDRTTFSSSLNIDSSDDE